MDVEEEEEDDDVEEENRSQDWEAHFVRACAIEMGKDRTQEPFVGKLKEKATEDTSGTPFLCAAVEMRMGISQEVFRVEFYKRTGGRQFRDTHFVPACTVEMHMDISQEPFCVAIC